MNTNLYGASPDNFDETGKPAGAQGFVDPGVIASINKHNQMERARADKDPKYVPKYVSIPRNANGIIQPASRQLEEWQNYGGCAGVPAGCVEEKQEPVQETVQETTVEQPETSVEEPEGVVPDTMAGIWKLLGYRKESLYDFGTRTLSPAGKKPSLEASLKAYKKNMLLTVARALLLREYGKDFMTEQVKKSAIASWKNNGRMKKYSDVLKENLGGPVEKLILEILGEVQVYLEGKVDSKAKYLEKYRGEKWSIKSFVLMCKVTGQVDLKKTGWRSTENK